jgi:ATP-dependent DNA helicase RecG
MPAVPCRTRLIDCVNQNGDDDQLFVVEVETSEKVHANRRDDVFLRVGDENRRLSFAQRQELLYDKGQATFESTVVDGVRWADLDTDLLGSYTAAVYHPDPRRLLARVCADLAFGQELGEGIRRMFEEMRLAGLADPDYHQTSGSVRVTLSSAPIDRALEARLPRGARELLRLVREAGRASTGELVEASSRSRPVVLRQLRALESAGLERWNGHSPKDPRAYWSLHVE